MSFWPQQIELKDLWINSLWALISGIIWSIIMFIIFFLLSSVLNVSSIFSNARSWIWDFNSIFPIILSIIIFLITSIVIFSTYIFQNLVNPERYKKNPIIFGQIAFFTFLTYIFVAPVYVFAWIIDYDYIMVVFLFHCFIVIFWTSIISEILNNYRYILVWLYGSFVWLFVTMIIIVSIFSSFDSGNAKLISLLFLLPLINVWQIFFKWLFEFWYFHYNKITGLDQIGDIFYLIELEDKEVQKDDEEKNSI